MSRQSASRRKREAAAFEQYHRADPAIAQAIHEKALVRAEDALMRNERTVKRMVGTFYHGTPYGKYFTPEKQAERDAKALVRKLERQERYSQGSFVSEQHFVSHVKAIMWQSWDAESTDDAISRAAADAAKIWGMDYALMLVGRAKRSYNWGVKDVSHAELIRLVGKETVQAWAEAVSNEVTELEKLYLKAVAKRQQCHTASGLLDYAKFISEHGDVIVAWTGKRYHAEVHHGEDGNTMVIMTEREPVPYRKSALKTEHIKLALRNADLHFIGPEWPKAVESLIGPIRDAALWFTTQIDLILSGHDFKPDGWDAELT